MPYAVTQHGNVNQRQSPTLKYLYLINLKHIKTLCHETIYTFHFVIAVCYIMH